MHESMLLPLLILIPILFALFSKWIPRTLEWMLIGVTLTLGIAFYLTYTMVSSNQIIYSLSNWLFLDHLSAYYLFMMILVFWMSSLYSLIYFKKSDLSDSSLGTFSMLWLLSMSAVMLVLLSNHVVLIWVGLEATTVFTTFLIALHQNKKSLEAMWKYLIICSLGVAFALIGTILLAASTHNFDPSIKDVLLWTTLKTYANHLDTSLLKIAFIFIFVGYGTKSGLAPMHTWLPDAHSQAPSPVSAFFSGFMINTGIYCIARFVPVIEAATNQSGFALQFVGIMGAISIMLAAVFIFFQTDLKRLLAYSSVEHMGIIALGLGLGGFGTNVALFHSLNHSISKTLSFFSAGRIGQIYETHDMKNIISTIKVSPVWGVGLLVGLLALIGMAPFSIFMSELQLIKAAVVKHSWLYLVVFLVGTSIVFIGVLKQAISMSFGKTKNTAFEKAKLVEYVLVILLITIITCLGVFMPESLWSFIIKASNVVNGVK